jgi:hypothetical protein
MDGLIEIMTEVDAMKSFRFADINEIMWWLRETAPTFGHVIKVDTAWSMMKIHRIKKLTRKIVFSLCFLLLPVELQVLHIKRLNSIDNCAEMTEHI